MTAILLRTLCSGIASHRPYRWVLIGLVLLAGCGKNNPLAVTPTTELSVAAGIVTTSAAPLFVSQSTTPTSFRIVLSTIDIIKGPGNPWISIYSNSVWLNISQTVSLPVGSTVTIPAGMYQGVRIRYRNDWVYSVTSPVVCSITNGSSTVSEQIWATARAVSNLVASGALSASAAMGFNELQDGLYLSSATATLRLAFDVRGMVSYDITGTNVNTISNVTVSVPPLQVTVE